MKTNSKWGVHVAKTVAVTAVAVTVVAVAAAAIGALIGASPAPERSRAMAVPEVIHLPPPEPRGARSLEQALAERRSVRTFAHGPLALGELSQLLWAAQGVTSRDGLRTAPSGGALYPLEVYAAVGAVTGLQPGLYRYRPDAHALTLVGHGDRRPGLLSSALGQPCVAEAPVSIVFTAVYERITGKYGERGKRYAWMEVGHAAQNLLLQATAMGLGAVPVGAFHDGPLARALDLPSNEAPLYIIPVGRPR